MMMMLAMLVIITIALFILAIDTDELNIPFILVAISLSASVLFLTVMSIFKEPKIETEKQKIYPVGGSYLYTSYEDGNEVYVVYVKRGDRYIPVKLPVSDTALHIIDNNDTAYYEKFVCSPNMKVGWFMPYRDVEYCEKRGYEAGMRVDLYTPNYAIQRM